MNAACPAISKNPAVLYTERTQKFGAAALKETQIGGVIDDTGKIRVLVIDAYGEAVG
jgi:hypothetical protein